MVGEPNNFWLFFSTYLPLFGIVLTIVMAWFSSGPNRTAALIVLPALTLAICWWIAEDVAREGNPRAVALYMSYVVSLVFYYPVIAVIWCLRYFRTRFGKLRHPTEP